MRTAIVWVGVVALVTIACNRNEAGRGSVLGGDRNQAKMTLTGCLQSGEQGLASREPNSASRSPEGADQFVLANAKMPGSSADSSPSASSPASTGSLFILEGEKAELQQHVGQQVEIVGEPKNDQPSTNDTNRPNVRRLDVDSVRMIAEHCSGI